jgi:hypothetical protein
LKNIVNDWNNNLICNFNNLTNNLNGTLNNLIQTQINNKVTLLENLVVLKTVVEGQALNTNLLLNVQLGTFGTKVNEILNFQNGSLESENNLKQREWLDGKFIFLESSIKNNSESVVISMSDQLGKLVLKADVNNSLLMNIIRSINILSANCSEGNFNQSSLITNLHESTIQGLGKSQEDQFNAIKCVIEINNGRLLEMFQILFDQLTGSLNLKVVDEFTQQKNIDTTVLNEITLSKDIFFGIQKELTGLRECLLMINGRDDEKPIRVITEELLESNIKQESILQSISSKVDMNKSLLLTLGSEFGLVKEAIFQDTYQNRNLTTEIKEYLKSQFEANILCYNSMVNDTFQNLANQVSRNVDIITSEKF